MGTSRIRARADRLRQVPLEAVLTFLGAERDPHDRTKWHTAKGAISVTPPKFMNWSRGVGGGGAIDLVIHLGDLGFLAALEWLARRFPEADHGPPGQRPSSPPAAAGKLALPVPDAARLARVRRYLLEERRLPAPALDALIEVGTIHADARANAVFLMCARDGRPIGAELRGTTALSWRGLARGSRKDLGCFSAPCPQARSVVLCESAIDALSCSALHPGALCFSTAGVRANPRWLAPLVQSGQEVLCGFDADTAGDEAARAMIEHHPTVERLRPPRKDWNDVLRAQR